MKSRLFFLLAAIMLFAAYPDAKSQDLIILKTGDEIQALVSEVGLDVVKYKKYENPDGPVYTIQKEKIFMIKYANGSKDVFNEAETPVVETPQNPATITPVPTGPQYLIYKRGITANGVKLSDVEIRNLFLDHPEPLKYYEQGQAFDILSSVCQWSVIGAGIVTALIMRPLPTLEEKNAVAGKGLIVMGGCAVGWITFGVIGSARTDKAVNTYNNEIRKETSWSFGLFFNGNEAGLAMRF